MKSCEYCGRENEDASEDCVECGTAFGVAEAPEGPEDLKDPALSLVTLATFRNVVDAGMLRARLEAAGIEACIPEEYTPQIFWTVIPSPLESVTVRVAAKDVAEAKSILADFDTSLVVFPPGTQQSIGNEPQKNVGGSDNVGDLKLCVACRAEIPATATLCPKCDYAQADL